MPPWIERHRLLIDFAVASLSRRKTRNGGLLAVYTLIVFVLGSIMMFGEAIRREAAAVLKGAPEVTAQAMRMGRHDFATRADIEKLGKLLGVKCMEGKAVGIPFRYRFGCELYAASSARGGQRPCAGARRDHRR